MTNCLLTEVLALIASSNAIKKGIETVEYREDFFIPQKLVNILNLVLQEYGIPASHEGDIHPETREKLWNIIWDYSIPLTDEINKYKVQSTKLHIINQ